MGKAQVKVKIKGSPDQVKKALTKLTGEAAPEPTLREADFRLKMKRQANG